MEQTNATSDFVNPANASSWNQHATENFNNITCSNIKAKPHLQYTLPEAALSIANQAHLQAQLQQAGNSTVLNTPNGNSGNHVDNNVRYIPPPPAAAPPLLSPAPPTAGTVNPLIVNTPNPNLPSVQATLNLAGMPLTNHNTALRLSMPENLNIAKAQTLLLLSFPAILQHAPNAPTPPRI